MAKLIRVMILVLGGLLIAGSIYILVTNQDLSRRIAQTRRNQEKAFKEQLVQERFLISHDLDKKYQSDVISFAAMAKRMEAERQRARELEEKLKDQRTEEPKN